MPTLTEVADEESRQWRAFNLLFSVLNGRGLAMAEMCHPLWGDWKRSVSKAKLMGCMLKCTATCNLPTRPYRSGKKRLALRQAAVKLMSVANENYFQSITERVLFDRSWQGGGGLITKDEFMQSRAIQRRLPYDPHPC